jgi:hypothetical protein
LDTFLETVKKVEKVALDPATAGAIRVGLVLSSQCGPPGRRSLPSANRAFTISDLFDNPLGSVTAINHLPASIAMQEILQRPSIDEFIILLKINLSMELISSSALRSKAYSDLKAS